MKNQIEKFLKEKFDDNVKFVEERYWLDSQGGSDTGYSGSDIEEGVDGKKYLKNSSSELTKNYIFSFEQEDGSWQEQGFVDLDDAESYVKNLD